uniref:CX domain-containing protein n=1 Tax=Acrobeloides nanus TaxID=290746 RepID=A0A914CAW0_9BILA
MAQEPISPWSRWDAPGFQYISHNTQPPQRQFDQPQPFSGVTSAFNGPTRQFEQISFVTSSPNVNDPSFIDCVYNLAGGTQQVVQQCYIDIGCCATTCCDNVSWAEKYGWAVALLVIFCIIVVIAFIIWFIVWLINRARDKQQRKQLIETPPQGMSPAQSQVHVGSPYQDGAPNPGYGYYSEGPYYPEGNPNGGHYHYGPKPYPY